MTGQWILSGRSVNRPGDMNTVLLTVEEVAQYAGVKPRRILEAARAGQLESIPIGKGTTRIHDRRFTPEAVDRWLQSITKEPKIL